MELFSGYCIDTNALIDLWRRYYPKDIFKGLWKEIDKLIQRGGLIAPKEVYAEIEVSDDELLKWCKGKRSMFIDLDQTQLNVVKQILKTHPNLVDSQKTTSDADPFVIALAKVKDFKLITCEKKSNPGGKPKIPDVCEIYKVKHLSLLEFFRDNGWKF